MCMCTVSTDHTRVNGPMQPFLRGALRPTSLILFAPTTCAHCSPPMHSVYRLYPGKRVCAQCLQTMHSVHMYVVHLWGLWAQNCTCRAVCRHLPILERTTQDGLQAHTYNPAMLCDACSSPPPPSPRGWKHLEAWFCTNSTARRANNGLTEGPPPLPQCQNILHDRIASTFLAGCITTVRHAYNLDAFCKPVIACLVYL